MSCEIEKICKRGFDKLESRQIRDYEADSIYNYIISKTLNLIFIQLIK